MAVSGMARYALLIWVGVDFTRAWAVAVALSLAHVILNALAVHVLVLKTLNSARSAANSMCI